MADVRPFIAQGPGATVANITLQDVCGQDLTDHLGIVYDSNVYQLILNALDPADQRPIACRPSPPSSAPERAQRRTSSMRLIS